MKILKNLPKRKQKKIILKWTEKKKPALLTCCKRNKWNKRKHHFFIKGDFVEWGIHDFVFESAVEILPIWNPLSLRKDCWCSCSSNCCCWSCCWTVVDANIIFDDMDNYMLSWFLQGLFYISKSGTDSLSLYSSLILRLMVSRSERTLGKLGDDHIVY